LGVSPAPTDFIQLNPILALYTPLILFEPTGWSYSRNQGHHSKRCPSDKQASRMGTWLRGLSCTKRSMHAQTYVRFVSYICYTNFQEQKHKPEVFSIWRSSTSTSSFTCLDNTNRWDKSNKLQNVHQTETQDDYIPSSAGCSLRILQNDPANT
jgi:hypothetical protein